MHLNWRSRNWNRPRDLVFKCEVNAQGTNRRVVITNRPGAAQYSDGTYQEYVDRDESENRNKELKLDFFGGRMSDHRFMANLFRLMMHSLSHNLLVRLRAISALPGVTDEAFCDATGSDELYGGVRLRHARNRFTRVRRSRNLLSVKVKGRCSRPAMPGHWRTVCKYILKVRCAPGLNFDA